MATKITLEMKGFEEYLNKLDRVGELEAAAKKAMRKGAKVLLKGMKQRAPKDTHNLEQKLKIEGPKIEGNLIVCSIGLIGADKETAIYGNVQEYGSAHTPAHPYIRPTMEEDKDLAWEAITAELLKELERWGF